MGCLKIRGLFVICDIKWIIFFNYLKIKFSWMIGWRKERVNKIDKSGKKIKLKRKEKIKVKRID